MMVFGRSRNILEVVHAFMEFFVEESCGYCTPCRVGNVLLKDGIERIMAGRGEPSDLVEFEQLGAMMKACSRCGLGQTSWRPVVTSLENFRPVYEELVAGDPQRLPPQLRPEAGGCEAEEITGRTSLHA